MHTACRRLATPLLSLALASAAPLAAQAQANPVPWQYEVSVYGWFPGISGTTSFPPNGNGPSMDVDMGDVIRALKFAFFGSFALIRTQTTIGDTAFLRSMIPHHSGAILMCQEAKLSDPEVIRLCEAIKRSQRQEIDEMKAILARR